jgi:hypothetical protein
MSHPGSAYPNNHVQWIGNTPAIPCSRHCQYNDDLQNKEEKIKEPEKVPLWHKHDFQFPASRYYSGSKLNCTYHHQLEARQARVGNVGPRIAIYNDRRSDGFSPLV